MATTVSRGFGCPHKYIQGPGEFRNLEKYISGYGQKVLMLIDSFLFDRFEAMISEVYAESSTEYKTVRFQGECSRPEIARVSTIASEFGADVVVGIGGGKALDAVKLVADGLGTALVIIPTSAATDAPTSALSVIYTEDGVHDGSQKQKRHSDLVLMDTEIIMTAPVRLFVSGMGDALATLFEAKAIVAADRPNGIGQGYRPCKAAMAIAQQSYDIIMEKGVQAKLALENGVLSPALEDVIEANTLLSGLGFENTGCAAAHGVHAGLTELPQTHSFYHGEKVAFGLLCQLVLENAPQWQIDELISFYLQVGLPLTLADFNVEATKENVYIIANKTVNGNALVHNEPFAITVETVSAAIVTADALGRQALAATGK